MPATERSPLLAHRDDDADNNEINENSPLLSNGTAQDAADHDDAHDEPTPSITSTKSSRKSRWPSIIAMFTLAVLVGVVIVLGFLVPPAVKTYAENAAVIEPTGLSLESITQDGIRARIQANFRLDGSRVADENAQRIGRIATSIMRKIETLETKLAIYVPHYGNAMLGSAMLPPISLDLVDGHNTVIDFVADLNPGDAEALRSIVNDWLDGKLDYIKVTGKTALSLKTGFLPLGTHDVVESMVFEASQVPALPEYKIQRLDFHDVPIGDGGKEGVGANITVTVPNDYPVSLTVPSLGFDILVSNCDKSQPLIKVATAVSDVIHVEANSNITADATGLVRKIPDSLIRVCPETDMSPLDLFMKRYLRGETARVFVQSNIEASDLPAWVGDFVKNITVPIAFPGRSVDGLIRNMTLKDVDFKLPSPFAGPDDPDSNPRVSGTVEVLAALPEGFDLDVDVQRLRATADLFYKSKKFGMLDLGKWQDAKSEKVVSDIDLLKITASVVDIPVEITDSDVFSDVLQKMLFGGQEVTLDVSALVDAQIDTAVGNLVVREVPAKGKVPLKHLPGELAPSLHPIIDDLLVTSTTASSVVIKGQVNFTNPTPYSATIPLLSMHVLANADIIALATVHELRMFPGPANRVSVSVTWDPLGLGGRKAVIQGRHLISDYLSGKNASIVLQSHNDSFPGMPGVGDALKKIRIEFPLPPMDLPDNGDDGGGEGSHGFIRNAVFHLFSSSATFDLASPLKHNTIYIEEVNATAFYNHTQSVGTIFYNESIKVPPGITETPYLPVEWDLDSVGFDKMKDALGGTLRLDAVANVTVRLGEWVEEIYYQGRGIGASIGF